MRFINLGDTNAQVFLFYQGSCTHWSWYKESLYELSKKFFVIVPLLDGYDKKNKTDFTSIEQIVKETTDYLINCGYKKIHAVYGLSLGGALTIRMLAENRIDIDKAIIDAGITPYQLPWIFTRFILLKDYLGITLLKTNIKFLKVAFDPKRWTKKNTNSDYEEIFNFIKSLSNKTVKNSFDSSNNYSMPKVIPNIKTKIQYWYGSREKKARSLDIKHVKKYFPNIVFKEIKNMEHGEFIMMHPKECTNMIIKFIN